MGMGGLCWEWRGPWQGVSLILQDCTGVREQHPGEEALILGMGLWMRCDRWKSAVLVWGKGGVYAIFET